MFTDLILNSRVLVACIKFLGVCLCLCCLAEKQDVSNMGTPSDMVTCKTKLWVDDEAWKKKIHKARRLIFKKGVNINGNRVKEILQSKSLVPNYVSVAVMVDDLT